MASVSVTIKDFRNLPGGITPDRLTWEFPVITSTNANGKATTWKIYVRVYERPGEFVPIQDHFFDSKHIPGLFAWRNVDSGLVGGKIKKTVPTIIYSGKNIGKKNETNVFTQALRDSLGIYNKQLKKSSAATGVTRERFPPMLSQLFKDQNVKPVIDDNTPVYVQRKYNGVRTVTCLDGGVIMYSRRKNLYPGFAYIKRELEPVLTMFAEEGRDLYLDGEIYKHGVALQDISGNSRREDRPGDIIYDYMIYDCFIPSEPELIYSQRKKILDDIFGEFEFVHAKNVETYQVHSEAEIDELYRKFLSEGYEGAMIRTDSPYIYSHNEYHSKNLLKLKPTLDSEYEIVRWETGEKGKAAEALMIVCRAGDKEFPVTPAREIPERIALAKKMNEIEPNGKTHFENHWKGVPLIVYYDELSKDGIPQRARTQMERRPAADIII